MSKYKDLFNLCSQPEEVITMDEAIISQQEEIINNYIITTNLEDSFNSVLHYLTLDRGKGFWVQGAYGSGKSHFMSYLTLLLNYDKYWSKVPSNIQEEYRKKFREKNYLIVNFTLSEVNDLRTKIFDEIEIALKKDGHISYIKNDRDIVNQFLDNEYNLINKEKFYEILKEGCSINSLKWEKALSNNNINQLAKIIIDYKQYTGAFSQKEYREVIYPSIKDGIQQIMKEVNKHYDGLVIFIDELSEFLQKKKQQSKEADALETIQALGQRIKKGPIWVIAAVQKHPAEIIDEDLYVGDEEEKVFDRFEPVILQKSDIEEIIDKRIIIKEDTNKKSIGYIYKDLEKRIPHLSNHITQDKFIKLYPFHYSFVSALIHLSSFGARQRVAVRECWNIVNKHLNDEADQLITIDLLYSIFKDTILHDYFKEYYDLYESLYSDIIERPDFKSDPELGHRLIKALIINGIYSRKPLSSIELTQSIMVDMGMDMELSFIYDDVYYTLMEIYEKSRGKGINIHEKGDDIAGHVWEIDPGSSGVKIDPEIISEVKLLNDNDIAGMVQELINQNRHFFAKYSVYWNSTNKMNMCFNWRNTERYGITIMKNILKIDSISEIDPVRDDIDFGLVIGFPLFGAKEDKINFCKNAVEKNPKFVYWIPEEINDKNKHIIKELVATKRLLDKYSRPKSDEDSAKKLQLETKYSNLSGELMKVIENCYLNGVMVAYNNMETNLKQYHNITGLINYIIISPLDKIYPSHPRYGKEITRRQTNKLIKEFIIPGESRELTNEMKNIANPLELIDKKDNGTYSLKIKNDLLDIVYSIISNDEWHEVQEIYKKLRKEPWGVQKFSFEVILATLISHGGCKGKSKNEEIINAGNLSKDFVSGGNLFSLITDLCMGNLISDDVWNDIIKITDIIGLDINKEKSSSNQDRIWFSLLNKFDSYSRKLESIHNSLSHLYSLFSDIDGFKVHFDILDNYNKFYTDIINSEHNDSYKGLSLLSDKVKDYFKDIKGYQKSIIELKSYIYFFEKRFDVTIKDFYNYFSMVNNYDSKIEDVKKIFKTVPDIISKPEKIRIFIKGLSSIKEDNQAKYVKRHNEYYEKLKRSLNKIEGMKEYSSLLKLNRISKIATKNRVESKIKHIKSLYCNKNIRKNDLNHNTRCRCNYSFEEPYQIDINKIIKETITDIKLYINEIQSNNYKDDILRYLQEHPNENVKSLININVNEIDKIQSLIDEDVIKIINKSLVSTHAVYINIDDVTDLVINKVLTGSISYNQVKNIGQRINQEIINRVKLDITRNNILDLDRVIIYFTESESEKNKKYIKNSKTTLKIEELS